MWEVRKIERRGGRRVWRVARYVQVASRRGGASGMAFCGDIAEEFLTEEAAQKRCDELNDEEEKAAALEDAAALIDIHEERLATYRLFQAAPELLSACEVMLPYLPDQNDSLNEATANEGRVSERTVAALRIRRAVARARGTASAPVNGLREITPNPERSLT